MTEASGPGGRPSSRHGARKLCATVRCVSYHAEIMIFFRPYVLRLGRRKSNRIAYLMIISVELYAIRMPKLPKIEAPTARFAADAGAKPGDAG
jgi:hypothetical protein